MTATVRIDRLSLHAGPLSEAQARRLAELVGLALGRVPLRAAGNVSVSVPALDGTDGRTVEQLADAVAHAIEAALRVDGAAT
ncbi:MAG TPA: hypothetical protein VF557_18215 [Jatrophihabitans sp.]|uniref:hypothetical protein n=1 Tax=Jatrophihabitans sp. TaxID=1932789 RepID=UPI002EF77CAF